MEYLIYILPVICCVWGIYNIHKLQKMANLSDKIIKVLLDTIKEKSSQKQFESIIQAFNENMNKGE